MVMKVCITKSWERALKPYFKGQKWELLVHVIKNEYVNKLYSKIKFLKYKSDHE